MMVFLVGFNQVSWVGFTNELLKLCDEDNRPLILVIQSIMQLPTSFAHILPTDCRENQLSSVFFIVLGCGIAGLC
jgi:hypothetical protein